MSCQIGHHSCGHATRDSTGGGGGGGEERCVTTNKPLALRSNLDSSAYNMLTQNFPYLIEFKERPIKDLFLVLINQVIFALCIGKKTN